MKPGRPSYVFHDGACGVDGVLPHQRAPFCYDVLKAMCFADLLHVPSFRQRDSSSPIICAHASRCPKELPVSRAPPTLTVSRARPSPPRPPRSINHICMRSQRVCVCVSFPREPRASAMVPQTLNYKTLGRRNTNYLQDLVDGSETAARCAEHRHSTGFPSQNGALRTRTLSASCFGSSSLHVERRVMPWESSVG